MHWFEVFIGIAFGLGGLLAILGSLACFIDRSFIMGLSVLSFGVSFVVYGVLHFAKGIGAEWAPRLQRDLFFGLQFLVLFFGCWLGTQTVVKRKDETVP